MFRDALNKLDRLECEDLLTQINPLLRGGAFDPRTATAMTMDMPFYPGYRFLDLSDHSAVPLRRVYAVFAKEALVVLDWTNKPIYGLNTSVPIQLNERNIVDYVRFFFAFVRGRHGRFLIVESVDDIAWKEEPPATARKAISNLIDPIRLRGIDNDGSYVLAICMIFKDSLFRATATIRPGGEVVLSEEELIVEDMPVLDDSLGA